MCQSPLQQIQVYTPEGVFQRGWTTGASYLVNFEISPRTGDIFVIHSQRVGNIVTNNLIQRFDVSGWRRAGWDVFRKYGDPVTTLKDLAVMRATTTTDALAVGAYCVPGYQQMNMANGLYLQVWGDLLQYDAYGHLGPCSQTDQRYRMPAALAYMALYFSETDAENAARRATYFSDPVWWTRFYAIKHRLQQYGTDWFVGIDYLHDPLYSYLLPMFADYGTTFTADFEHYTLQPHINSSNYSDDVWQKTLPVNYPSDVIDTAHIGALKDVGAVGYIGTTDQIIVAHPDSVELYSRTGDLVRSLNGGGNLIAVNQENGNSYVAAAYTIYQYSDAGDLLQTITPMYRQPGTGWEGTQQVHITEIVVSGYDNTLWILGAVFGEEVIQHYSTIGVCLG